MRETIKSRFRRTAGYKEGYKCGDCTHCKTYEYAHRYYKCEVMGLTNSTATDIRKKDVACNYYDEVMR